MSYFLLSNNDDRGTILAMGCIPQRHYPKYSLDHRHITEEELNKRFPDGWRSQGFDHTTWNEGRGVVRKLPVTDNEVFWKVYLSSYDIEELSKSHNVNILYSRAFDMPMISLG